MASPTPLTAPARWRRRKEARPQEIVSAALHMFVERGFAATRLEDVARRAGVTKGTVYLYFEDKHALFRAVVQQAVVPEIQRMEELVRDHRGSAAEAIRALVRHWWAVVGESHLCGIPKLVIAEAGNFPDLGRFFVQRVVRRGRKLFSQLIRDGVRRGEFRKCDARYATRLLMSPMVFAAIWERSLKAYDKEPYSARRLIEIHLDVFLRGMARHR
jgi:AcrR family transcriptional regulator